MIGADGVLVVLAGSAAFRDGDATDMNSARDSLALSKVETVETLKVVEIGLAALWVSRGTIPDAVAKKPWSRQVADAVTRAPPPPEKERSCRLRRPRT
ncbi:hypothetical protein GCM10022252_09880 [Streptosporangium oxazolinicum]|uniref:Uncharacterized protein n=1 Tax=Streptosporangium oxazolinicum TaxID=909287 RepID=A0ABP8AFH5_9ACTN